MSHVTHINCFRVYMCIHICTNTHMYIHLQLSFPFSSACLLTFSALLCFSRQLLQMLHVFACVFVCVCVCVCVCVSLILCFSRQLLQVLHAFTCLCVRVCVFGCVFVITPVFLAPIVASARVRVRACGRMCVYVFAYVRLI